MLRAFVNCAMVLKKRLNFFYFQWKKVNQVRSEYLRSYLNWLHNWQLKSRRRSHALKGSHSIGDRRILLKPRRDDSFKKVLSNEPNFGRIHLAGQYLKAEGQSEQHLKHLPLYRLSRRPIKNWLLYIRYDPFNDHTFRRKETPQKPEKD